MMGADTGEGSVGTGAGQGEGGLCHPRVGGKLWRFSRKASKHPDASWQESGWFEGI